MSGRAGRRGIDSVGTVIIVAWDETPDSAQLHKMILGQVQKLSSQFRLSYNMILNLLRVEDFKVEDMIKRSFSELHSQRAAPEQANLLKRAQTKLQQLEEVDCIFCPKESIGEYYQLMAEIKLLNVELQKTLAQSRTAQSVLTPGRVLRVSHRSRNALAAIVESAAPSSSSSRNDPIGKRPLFGSLSGSSSGLGSSSSSSSAGVASPGQEGEGRTYRVVMPRTEAEMALSDAPFIILEVPFTAILAISKTKLKVKAPCHWSQTIVPSLTL
jgi:antiviral helicase SKI2